ncbi:MAG: DUF4388 domain-containing protein [Candidatus Zixiibacteriota bacterium]
MSRKHSTLRIDEILLWQGLVNEDQVKAALEYQREHGGRLGSHLVRLGYVTEEQLLGALARQFNCETVVLSRVAIPPDIVRMLPANLAVARTVIPFAYDKATNTLSIACENPKDKDLIEELKFVTGGKKIRLCVAAELSLRPAVTQYYASELLTSTTESADDVAVRLAAEGTAILLVSDDLDADRPLVAALERDDFRVVCSDSADDAIRLIGKQTFCAVFIRDTVPGDYIDLIDRLRKVSPRTRVRYYESVARMLLHESGYRDTEDLIVKNTQLFTSLLAPREPSAQNHAVVVGKYVDRLCKQLGLPDKDRINIVNAAYLHDISRYYYGESKSAPDCRTRVQMTAKLLDSLSYPPLIVGMLRSMYIDLEQKYTKRLPIEPLGGNILTIVDVFCENVTFDKRLSLDKFELVRGNLEAMTGRLFLREVTTAFLALIEQEILDESSAQAGTFSQVLMYCEDMDYLSAIAGRLKEEGFRPVSMGSTEKFVEMYHRSRPDMMVLLQSGSPAKARQLVSGLAKKGVDLKSVPTFLISGGQAASDLAAMLEFGLEDVIPIENSLDLLVVKLDKLRTRFAQQAGQGDIDSDSSTVTSGNLEDMNLVDLLQAMGPGGRTAKIRVASEEGKLTICLDKGKIIFAQCGDKSGAEAVYEAVTWRSGKWVVRPIKPEALPEPNNDTANEALLMEGCRRLDEKTRTAAK